ncbi:MAG: gluconolactonase [Armatimonadetes bacterium]|jgi:gluconolactonase|nr:gluconolactonase [Armatimonadota bacterium]
MQEVNALSARFAEVFAPDLEIEQIATGFRFTEGPLWDTRNDTLYFSDILANRIYRWTDGGEGVEVFRTPSGKSNGLTWDLAGHLLACEHLNRRVTLTLADGTIVELASRYQGKRLNSPNDLVVHSDGSVYFTDPPYGILSDDFGAITDQEQPHNGVYRIRPGADEPELLLTDFDRPNGLAFSPDEARLYIADTSRYQIRAFDVAEDGSLSGGDVFAQFREEDGVGRPDGMKVDQAGNVYTTGPGGLWVVAPDGEVLGHLRFPEKTANCGWGDADLRSLYVTASTSVYRVRTLISGIPPRRG